MGVEWGGYLWESKSRRRKTIWRAGADMVAWARVMVFRRDVGDLVVMDKGEEMERGVKEDSALLFYTTGVDQSVVHREAQRSVSLGKEALAILHWRHVYALAAVLSCGVGYMRLGPMFRN